MHLNEALYLQIPLQLKATGGQTTTVCVFAGSSEACVCVVSMNMCPHVPRGDPHFLVTG